MQTLSPALYSAGVALSPNRKGLLICGRPGGPRRLGRAQGDGGRLFRDRRKGGLRCVSSGGFVDVIGAHVFVDCRDRDLGPAIAS